MTREKMEIIIYKILSDITGQEPEEIKEYCNANMFESGILDSLSLGVFLVQFHKKTNCKLSFSDFKPIDFESINTLRDALYRIVKSKNGQ